MLVDLVALGLAVGGFAAAGVGHVALQWDPRLAVTVSVGTTLATLGAMSALRCWEPAVLGQGAEEFIRLLRAFLAAMLLLALVGTAFEVAAVRPWVFGAVPAAAVAVVLGRWLVRRALHRARARGRCLSPVLVVGTDATVADLVARTRRVPHHGWTVVAACTSTGRAHDGGAAVAGVPVVGDLDAVARRARELAVEVVAVAPTPGWSPRRLHRLSWEIEGTAADLVVDPGLMEIAGPRLHMAPVDGLPLLRLSEPRLGGPARLLKTVIDRGVSALLLVLLAPLLLLVAVAIRSDGGPVLFRQERVGRRGRTFRMLKFRSMVVDAEDRLPALSEHDEGAGPLFKVRADPRITRVGAVLRRFSVDELPQLANVLAGHMSLVGPRPALPREVAAYADDSRRRLVVRPGLTGLWQVSGRSELSWEESVRLDLRYVENWSPALDAVIVWKTVGAVVRGRGAC